MTDIVERLRDLARQPTDTAWIAHDAANEIDRLRTKLAEYENVPVRLCRIMKTGTMPPEDMK